jgi:phage gp36-like protein
MPVYTSLPLLAKRLDPAIIAGLADDVNAPPDIEDPETVAVISQAITDGASLIDSYLLGRIDLSTPLTQAALERLNATLALYFLYQRRYLNDALNPLSSSKELVMAHLAAVSRGVARLSDGDDGSPEMLVFSTTEDVKREVDARKF